MKHLDIDIWGTVEKLQEQNSGIYDMILMGAMKAREIAKKRNHLDEKEGRIKKYPLKPINQALKEIEDEINKGE